MSQTEAPAAAPFKYRAFISYSHRDAAWADWLHKAVERYRVPRALVGRTTAQGIVSARLTPLFRDREELAASTDLSAVITAALQSASHLVVLCSPRSAQSKWVNEEILAFKRLGREDRIVAIIVDGEPNSGDPATECFPEALKFRIGADGGLTSERTEPVAADARDTGDGKDNAKLKLIAGLLGVGLDELKRRELQAQRRRTAFAYGLTGVFALLAVAAVWFAVEAVQQQRRAEAQEKEAIAQRDRANAAVDTARDTAEFMVTEFAGKLRTAPGAQYGVLGEILESSIGLLEQLGETSPLGTKELWTLALARMTLANALSQLGRHEGALEEIDKSLSILTGLAVQADAPPSIQMDIALAQELRGNALLGVGKPGDALAAFEESKAIRLRELKKHPNDLTYREVVARSDEKIGEAYFAQDDRPKARTALEAALKGAEALDPFWPKEDWPQRLILPRVLTYLGNLIDLMGDSTAARPLLQRAAEKLDALSKDFPNNTEVSAQLGTSESNYAALLKGTGDLVGAESAYRRALERRRQLHRLDRDNFEWTEDLYRNCANLSSLSYDLKKFGLALYYVRWAIRVLEEKPDLTAKVQEWREDLELFRGWERDLVASGVAEEDP